MDKGLALIERKPWEGRMWGKTLLVAAATAVWSCTPALGDQATDAGKCSSITDSLQRLTCFDRIFPAGSSDGPETKTAPDAVSADSAKWEVTETKSVIDDSPTVMAFLAPAEVNGTGVGKAEMFLMVRCQENTTAAVLATNMFMTDEMIRVTLRFGAEAAETSSWGRSTNYKSVGLWNGAKAIPFLKKLASNDKLVVRIEANDRSDAQFDLGEAKSVVEKVAAACKWSLD